MEDLQIIGLYFARDETALKETAAKYGAPLRRLSYQVLQDNRAAEECENDTYLSAWDSIPPHRPEQFFFAYLAKIIRRLSFNRYRMDNRQKRSACLVELSTELEQCVPYPGGGEWEEQEFSELIQSFLESLPETERRVFLRRYWFCDAIKDICSRFSMGESRVKSMLMRTRNKLRLCLQKEGYDL